MAARTIYRKELKDFLRQQAQTGLTITELKEQCSARFPEYEFTNQRINELIRNNHIKRIKPEKENRAGRTLTPEERDCAEQNINVVYDYLYRNRMETDEWFDIVIFGYLYAVMDYHRKRELRQYAFTTIAWHAMEREVSNYRAYGKALKRSFGKISIDKTMTEGGERLGDIIPDPSAERQFREAEFRHDLKHQLEMLDHEQRSQFYMMCSGYNVSEVRKKLGISKGKQRKNKLYMQTVLYFL